MEFTRMDFQEEKFTKPTELEFDFENLKSSQSPHVECSPKLEICVDNIQSAINAAEGEADRIELCHALELGGLTPSAGLVRQVKDMVDIPIFMMIRPRAGNFNYTDYELLQMQRDMENGLSYGVNGFVTGALHENGTIDEEACARLIDAAQGLPVTFHRAFDIGLYENALEDVIKLGFCRILTSGYECTAYEGMQKIKELVHQAADRIIIMAGSGINSSNIRKIYLYTKAREFHSSGQAVTNPYQEVVASVVKGTVFYPMTKVNVVREMLRALYGHPEDM